MVKLLFNEKIKKILKKIFFRNGNYWNFDPNNRFLINTSEVKRYFDTVKETPLSVEGEKIEEKVILGLVDIRKGMKVLDLGCGEGRWAKVLDSKGIEYTGVDFSNELIKKAKKNNFNNYVSFVNKPAQEYYLKEKFDLILLFGLIPYMNDEEIRQLSKNCFEMLEEDGKLILRDVALNEKSANRKIYDDKYNLLRKILFFRRPRYQLIRRSLIVEIDFFKEFSLIDKKSIKGTNLRVKIFKKNLSASKA